MISIISLRAANILHASTKDTYAQHKVCSHRRACSWRVLHRPAQQKISDKVFKFSKNR